MLIRDAAAPIEGDETVTKIPSGKLQILTDNGRVMFEIRACPETGCIELLGGELCKLDGKLFGETLMIQPRYPHSVYVRKLECQH